MTDAVNPYRRLSPRADESDLVNFGSVPGTRAEDGDPLDVLVILESPSFAGCLVTARLIGGLHVEQFEKRRKVRNDRLIAMPETAVNKPDIRSLQQLGRSRRTLRIVARCNARRANTLLSAAIKAHRRSAA
jgi:inorganic pyrophosphatase